MFDRLKSLLVGSRPNVRHQWTHISAQQWPAAVYAIGDIHGCLAELKALEGSITEDAARYEGEKWLIYLGDYVDRGPNSAGVIDHLMAKQSAGLRRICLAGNHEAMALAYLRSPTRSSDWLNFGGTETLQSYGINPADLHTLSPRALPGLIQSHVPEEHLQFLEQLHLSFSLPRHTFVHAGLRPGIALELQVEEDLLWIREDFFRAPPADNRVIHGHTPGAEVFVSPERICVDTGAFATGVLSAVRLDASGDMAIFTTNAKAQGATA